MAGAIPEPLQLTIPTAAPAAWIACASFCVQHLHMPVPSFTPTAPDPIASRKQNLFRPGYQTDRGVPQIQLA